MLDGQDRIFAVQTNGIAGPPDFDFDAIKVTKKPETTGPELLEHYADPNQDVPNQTGLSYDVYGQKIQPNSPRFQTEIAEQRSRILIRTRSLNTYVLDGKTLYDLEASRAEGRVMAIHFEQDEILPIFEVGKTKIPSPTGQDETIEKMEVSFFGEPDEDSKELYTYRHEDPFAKFDQELWDLENQHTSNAKKARFSRFGKTAIAGLVSTVKAKSLSFGEKLKQPKNVIRRRQAAAVIAIAAVGSYAAVEVMNSNNGGGNNTIAVETKNMQPRTINAAGRDPWVISAAVLRKYGPRPFPSNPEIHEYDEKLMAVNDKSIAEGEDRTIADDETLILPPAQP